VFIDVLLVWCVVKFDWANFSGKILFDNPQLSIEAIFHIFYFILASLDYLVKHFKSLVNFLDLFCCDILIINSPFGIFLFERSNLSSEIFPQTKVLLFKSSNYILKSPKFSL